jgi:hypothetical protein
MVSPRGGGEGVVPRDIILRRLAGWAYESLAAVPDDVRISASARDVFTWRMAAPSTEFS